MSNYLAIATVTEVLRQKLQEFAEQRINGTEVIVGSPGDGVPDPPGEPRIRMFLYQVLSNPALRNLDLPTRRNDGSLVTRPQAALNLHYLFTFYGNETEVTPQRLLGLTTSFLHARSTLFRETIRKVIGNVAADSWLKNSDLADQLELIKFTPLTFSIEEISQLWSTFSQTPYALSVAYTASAVLIEAEETPQDALPVRARHVYVKPFLRPTIERITSEPTAGEPEWMDDPILADHTLVISGKQLRGDETQVVLDGEIIDDPSVSGTQIQFPLTTPPVKDQRLRAGVHSVQVFHRILMGKPEVLHRGFESNLAAFVLRPRVMGVDSEDSTKVEVTFHPKVGKRQRVALLLNESDPPEGRGAHIYRFKAPPDNGITDENETETDRITFLITDVVATEYLVRVQVDGAESPLVINSDGRFIAPKVEIHE